MAARWVVLDIKLPNFVQFTALKVPRLRYAALRSRHAALRHPGLRRRAPPRPDPSAQLVDLESAERLGHAQRA